MSFDQHRKGPNIRCIVRLVWLNKNNLKNFKTKKPLKNVFCPNNSFVNCCCPEVEEGIFEKFDNEVVQLFPLFFVFEGQTQTELTQIDPPSHVPS